MMTSFFCKIPSGASTMQVMNFVQEVNYGFFGKYMDDSRISKDYERLINLLIQKMLVD